MDEATLLTALRRHWEYAATDQEITHEIYHDDAVLEFPQSQERFEGKANFIAWRRFYPASLQFEIRRIRGRGDFWMAENSIRYDGGPWNYTCSILEFRGDKIARETIYITQGWEVPQAFTSRFFIKLPPEAHEPWTWSSSFWEPRVSLAMVLARSAPRLAHHLGSTFRQL